MVLSPWAADPSLSGEAYCKRAAWAWLLAHVRPTDNCTIRRGQIDVTLTGLGAVWSWHHTQVKRWLQGLVESGHIEIEEGPAVRGAVHGFVRRNLRLTICNLTTIEGARHDPVRDAVRTVVRTEEPSPAPPQPPRKKGPREGALEGFDAFYAAYPRKVGRGAAERAWRAAVQKAQPDAIMAGLQRLLPGLMAQEPGYRPHPSTWLNQRRWEDQPEEDTRDRHHPARRPASGQQQLFEAALDLAEDLRARGR